MYTKPPAVWIYHKFAFKLIKSTSVVKPHVYLQEWQLKLKGRFMGFVIIKIERKIYGTKHIHMSMASPKRVAKF